MNLASTPRQRPRLRKMAKRTLASLLEEYGSLPVVDAVDIALDVCDALARPNVRLSEGGIDLESVFLVWPASPAMRHLELTAPPNGDGRQATDPIVAVADLIFLLVVGAAPSVALSSLAIAPLALAMTVDACITKDPRAPRTLDELAERVATFASSPPERFERLAARRAEIERARLRAKRRDTEQALDRLDRAAALRQLDPASVVAPRPVREVDAPVHPEVLSRLINAVDRSTGSEASVPSAPPSPLDAGASLKLAPIRLPREEVASVFEPRVAALSVPPVALAPPAVPSAPTAVAQAEPTRLFTVLVLIAACACVAVGVFAGAHLFHRTAPASVRAVAPSPRPKLASLSAPTVATSIPSPPVERAPSTTAASLPDVVTTPAALPDARPPQRRVAPRPPKPRETAAPVAAARNTDDVLPPDAPPYKSQD